MGDGGCQSKTRNLIVLFLQLALARSIILLMPDLLTIPLT